MEAEAEGKGGKEGEVVQETVHAMQVSLFCPYAKLRERLGAREKAGEWERVQRTSTKDGSGDGDEPSNVRVG